MNNNTYIFTHYILALLHDFTTRKIKTKFHSPNNQSSSCERQQYACPPSGLPRFFKLHSLQQTLKTEVVGVAVDRRLVGTRAHHFGLQRREGAGSTSLHVHLQLQQDLQGVGHLCLAVDGGQEASAAITHYTRHEWIYTDHRKAVRA